MIESAGYTAEPPAPSAPDGASSPDPLTRALGRRLAVCVPLAVAVIVLAMVPAAQFAGWQWVSLLLAAPVAAWGAWPLHRSVWPGLGHGAATMDTLVSLGVAVSFGWSAYALLFGGADMTGMRMSFAFTFGQASGHTLYLEVAAGVTTAVLAGRYLEARARDRSGSALTALASLGAKTVAVLRDGAEQRLAVDALVAGDLFVVRPGEKIATDGAVVEGSSAVDASLVTGESVPAEVGPGDRVTGATVNMSGRLVVRATRVGSETLLAQITRLVSQAQSTKVGAQRLADRIAAVFVPCVISLAVATLGFWLGAGLPAASAWSAAVAVLVVACPCALGLAGTVEDASEHPIGQAIARAAAACLGVLPPVTGFAALPGAGVRGTVDGRLITVGSLRLFGELSLAVPVALVGDGVNDAAALAQANLGMAIGAGADAAIGAADLTLIGGDPSGVADAIELARATGTVIRANLAWASGYNLIAIPLAALGYLNPLFAGIAMSASSLIVVGNSLRLRRFHAGPPRRRPSSGRPADREIRDDEPFGHDDPAGRDPRTPTHLPNPLPWRRPTGDRHRGHQRRAVAVAARTRPGLAA